MRPYIKLFATSGGSRGMRLTPLRAIRKQCVQCMGGSPRLVADCPGRDCPLYPYRMGRLDGADGHTLRAIRQYCLGCAGSSQAVRDCYGDTAVDGPYPLYRFRLGKNPNISKETRQKRRMVALKHGFGKSGKLHEQISGKKQPKLPLDGF